MDELVIINPAYSGSSVWQDGADGDLTICEQAERKEFKRQAGERRVTDDSNP